MLNIVEIDGVKYEQIESSPATKRYLNSKIGTFMAMSMIMAGSVINPRGGSGEPERPSVDIVEEYKLILEKKSKLSRSQREWVVSTFKRKFKKVEPES